MKYLMLSTILLIFLYSCGNGSGHANDLKISDFKSEKISRTATINLNGSIENVFPLFNPVEEQKWAPKFKPQFIYPSDQTVQEGMSFKTAGYGGEAEFLWIITRYDKEKHLIQYLVSTPNRYWTIGISCKEAESSSTKTNADVTYTFFALNEKGIELNEKQMEMAYTKNLKYWESAINDFLEK